MADLQQNPEGSGSFDNELNHKPGDASDDTVAFAQVSQNQEDNQAYGQEVTQLYNQNVDDYEESLVDNLGEVADESDDKYDFDNDAESDSDSYSEKTAADSIATDTFNVVKPKAKSKGNRSAVALMYSLIIFVVLIAAAFFATQWYFHNRVAPGVEFGNAAISRSISAAEKNVVERAVRNAVENSSVDITDDRGNSFTASLEQLGVKVDHPATVKAIMDAKRDNFFTRIMPWVQKTVTLKAKRDDAVMDLYVLKKFVRENDRALPYSARFDESSESFVVEDGVPGRTVETMSVREAVKKIIAHPGKNLSVSVTSRKTEAPIKREVAQKFVDDLNKLLAKKISFNNGDDKDFTLPKSAIASWINVKADTTRHKLSYTIDKDKADEYLSQALPKDLNQQKVNQEDAINKEGKVIFTTMKGSNGVEITYSRSLAEKACDALRKGNDFKMTVPSKLTKFTVEQKIVEMRIVVDKTTQTATVYKNDEVVKTFPVCTGKLGDDDSTPGTFFIYLRYASQDMRGRNGDGSSYFSPGVRWVSYYHGGEGFHTASWNYNGIATGDAANHGSHGCINMYEQDARWVYENCPRGTIVQVVGNTPDGPVRQ